MLEIYQSLKVFISSPGDLPDERVIAERVIAAVNNSCRDTLGIHVDTHTWKGLPPITPNMPEETIQQMINDEVRRCNAFVLLLYKRYGTVESGHLTSNTAREIEVALNMRAEGKKMMFLSYFKELPANEDPGEQQLKVSQLRNALQNRGVFYCTFTDVAEFRERFTHDLYHSILRFHASTSKQKALKSFWQLGLPERSVHPRLAIMYPPVDRRFMREERPDRYWLRRLLPHVVFEDCKAMQKVEKTLRLIGFRDFQFYNVWSAPNDLQDQNRMWICLPRNEPAQHQLEIYKDRADFQFVQTQSGLEIQWRYSKQSSSWITIQSPLAKYLRRQRKAPAAKSAGRWRLEGGTWQGVREGLRYSREVPGLETDAYDGGHSERFFPCRYPGARNVGSWLVSRPTLQCPTRPLRSGECRRSVPVGGNSSKRTDSRRSGRVETGAELLPG